MNLTSNLDKIKDLKLKPVLRVSQRGAALYLYIPKDIVEVCGVRAGDKIEVELRTLYRPKPETVERPM